MKHESARLLVRPAQVGALLRIGPEALSVYWSNPSRGIFAAGIGVADERRGAPTSVEAHEGMPGPWFGGWAFDEEREWEGFDGERWVLPEVLAWWDGKKAWLAAFGIGASDEQLAARLDAVSEVEPSTGGNEFSTRPGDRAAWGTLVENALMTIQSGACSKLVLARVIDAEFSGSERGLLKSLEARHPSCWTFLVRGRDGQAFIGATPETLVESNGSSIAIDALAGTCAAGKGAELLKSDKDLREHFAVVNGIHEAIAPFVDAVEIPSAPVIKPLANVEHLFTPIRARLKSGTALEVARALHPTPAVSGTPKQTSIEWLRANEGFARGWYAGAVGAIGAKGVTLAVALRSVLLEGTRARIFVGAGVVQGSTADAEWNETERKSWAVLGGAR